MKRLTFLKTSLDNHNPDAAALESKDRAEKIKTRRLWELWKHDIDKNTGPREQAIKHQRKLNSKNPGG